MIVPPLLVLLCLPAATSPLPALVLPLLHGTPPLAGSLLLPVPAYIPPASMLPIPTTLLSISPLPALDDADAERERLRQVLTLLAEQPMSEALAATYEELHGRALRLGDTDTAHDAIQRIVAWWETTLGAESLDLSDRANRLGAKLHDLGDFAAARRLYERVLAIREAALGSDHPRVADAVTNLAILLKDVGEYDAARAHYERALALREAIFGADHPDVADALNNLAILLVSSGELDAARPLHERALAIREDVFGPDDPRVGDSLNNLAILMQELGDLRGARTLYEQAYAIRAARLGEDHPALADSLNNLAIVSALDGDLVAARPLYERALAIREAALGPHHPAVADSLHNLAALLWQLGDSDAARVHDERALAIYEAAFGADHPAVASVLIGLANLPRDEHGFDEARRRYERALAIYETALGPGHPVIALCLDDLAMLLREFGEHETARPLMERSLAIRESALDADHPDLADSLDAMAHLLADDGEPAAARPFAERALAIRETALGDDSPAVARSLYGLTILALDEDDPVAAWPYAQRLWRHVTGARRVLATLTEGEAFQYLALLRRYHGLFLTAAAALGETDAAWSSVLDTKGRIARLTLRSNAQRRRALDLETRDLVERLTRLQTRLSSLALAVDVAEGAAHVARFEELRAERDRVERELRRSADFAEPESVTPADVADALPPRSAMVDLLVHASYVPPRVAEGGVVDVAHFSAPRVSAWIVRAGGGAPVHVDLGDATAVEDATRAFLRGMDGTVATAARGVVPVDRTADHAGDGALRALVWDPLVPHLEDVETVFVSPDGVLAQLPFGALQERSGRYLIEERSFVYPADAASLVRTEIGEGDVADGRPASGRQSREPSLLVVGGVDFERRDASSGPRRARPSPLVAHARDDATRIEPRSSVDEDLVDIEGPGPGATLRGAFEDGWRALPATAAESRAVADAFDDAFGDDGRRLLLQGRAANEEQLAAQMPHHRILHLATHGFFRPAGLPALGEPAPASSRSREADPFAPASFTPAGRVTGLHPGLLSGLVLAGANGPPADETASGADDPDTPLGDDGYLTASEVTLLDLSAVDLVVLSACETGLGRPQSGEGLLGLRRAFHMAGADTVISSLWSVKDESTSELMQSFYANLFFKGMGRHEALRAAQLEMLQRNRMEHDDALPSTWGAFVLSGEWR